MWPCVHLSVQVFRACERVSEGSVSVWVARRLHAGVRRAVRGVAWVGCTSVPVSVNETVVSVQGPSACVSVQARGRVRRACVGVCVSVGGAGSGRVAGPFQDGGEPPPSERGTCGRTSRAPQVRELGRPPSPCKGSASLDATREPWGIRLEATS